MNRLEACLLLHCLPGLGWQRSLKMSDHFGSPEAIFLHSKKEWDHVEGVGLVVCNVLSQWKQYFPKVQIQIQLIKKYGITPLFFGSVNYPKPLTFCADAPLVLFTKGKLAIENRPILSVIGTRQYTPYGKSFCESLIKAVAPYDPIICSGLARGIDIIAHRETLKQGLDTVACLAHGLDQIYPSEHRTEANKIMKQGLLVTDFLPQTVFLKGNFPRRNRLIAGMAIATVVIESGIKGGSMNTANLAHSYGRELFAVPGRTTDIKSMGCHELIVQQKAQLLSDPYQLIETLGWNTNEKQLPVQQKLFISLTSEEQKIIDLFNSHPKLHLDELVLKLEKKVGPLSGLMLQLEMKGAIRALPGKYFERI